MKKFFVLTLALVIWLGLLSTSFAVGTVVVTTRNIDNNKMMIVQYAWTADAAAATVPATALTSTQAQTLIGSYLCGAETIPGSTAPTALYDITITNSNSVDLFGGMLGNRSATVSEYTVPAVATGVYGCRFVDSSFTFNLSNNSVNSATGTLKLYLYRP